MPVQRHNDWLVENNHAAVINMFSVGDGSCFLIRLQNKTQYNDQGQSTHTIMFDCGSKAYFDVGKRSIAPALQSLGVSHIDTVIISHADLDHYGGVLDLLDKVTVSRVLVPPQLLINADTNPGSANRHLVDSLRRRNIPITSISRGHVESWAGTTTRFLWPPDDLETKRANDTSLVLSLRVAGRRILLNGDINRVGLPMLLQAEADLQADITDLPHHGSFTPSSVEFLDRVSPTIALQSCDRRRLDIDSWAPFFEQRTTTRLITARHGMVQITIDHQGVIEWASFRDQNENGNP